MGGGRVPTKKKVSSYIAQYPIFRIAQSALHITSLADLFNQTPSQLLWEAYSHMLQLMREGCLYTYPPLVYSQVLIYTAEWTSTSTESGSLFQSCIILGGKEYFL